MMIGTGLSIPEVSVRQVTGAVGPPANQPALDYFAAMTAQPDATRKGLLNDMIAGMIADGSWALIKRFGLLASHDAQSSLVDVAFPAKAIVPVNSPIFTVDRGYKSNGSSSYIDVGEGYFAAGGLQDSITGAIYINAPTSSLSTPASNMGWGQASAPVLIQTSTASSISRANEATGRNNTFSSPAGTGFFATTRTASNATAYYIGSANVGALSAASLAPNNTSNANLLRTSNSYTTSQLAAYIIGLGWTDAQEAAIFARLDTYLRTIGAGF